MRTASGRACRIVASVPNPAGSTKAATQRADGEEHGAAERRRAENLTQVNPRICDDGAQPRRNPNGNLLNTDAASTAGVASASDEPKLRPSGYERKKCAIRAFQALPARDRGDRLPVGRRGSFLASVHYTLELRAASLCPRRALGAEARLCVYVSFSMRAVRAI